MEDLDKKEKEIKDSEAKVEKQSIFAKAKIWINDKQKKWASTKFVRKFMLDDFNPNLGGNIYKWSKFSTKFMLIGIVPVFFIVGIFVVGFNPTYNLEVSYQIEMGGDPLNPIMVTKNYGTTNNESSQAIDMEIVDITGEFPSFDGYTTNPVTYFNDVSTWYANVMVIENQENSPLADYISDNTYSIYKAYASDIDVIVSNTTLLNNTTISNADLWVEGDVKWVLGARSDDGYNNIPFIAVVSLIISLILIEGFIWFHFSIFSEEDSAKKPILKLRGRKSKEDKIPESGDGVK